MGVENPSGIFDLNENWPGTTETRREGDDHLRLIKKSILLTFANVITNTDVSGEELNYLASVVAGVAKASKAIVLDSNADLLSGIHDFTVDGNITGKGALAVIGAATIGGAVNAGDNVTVESAAPFFITKDTSGTNSAGLLIRDASDVDYAQVIYSLTDAYFSLRTFDTSGVNIQSEVRIYKSGRIWIHAENNENVDVAVDGTGQFTYNGEEVFTDVAANIVGATGSVLLPSGLIMKWGQISPGGSASGTLTFSASFPSNCFNVQLTAQRDSAGGITSDDGAIIGNPITASNFRWVTATDTDRLNWVAYGN